VKNLVPYQTKIWRRLRSSVSRSIWHWKQQEEKLREEWHASKGVQKSNTMKHLKPLQSSF
jgi:hypothetical protein